MDKIQAQKFLNQRNLRPLKRLGQNFLIHPELTRDIAERAKTLPKPYVEIGPGLGALTQSFAHRKKDILLVEKDKKLAAYWEQEGWQVLCADILKLNWEDLPQKFSLFGNLPYEIFGSLIIKAAYWQSRVQSLLLMGQKELGLRVTASPGGRDYGFLSVAAQSFWSIQPVLDVPASAFYPRPKVAGRVLLFRPKSQDPAPPAGKTNSPFAGLETKALHSHRKMPGKAPLPFADCKTEEQTAAAQLAGKASPFLAGCKTAKEGQTKEEVFQLKNLEPESFLRFLRLCFRFKRKKLIKQLPAPSPQSAEQALKALSLPLKVRAEELSPLQFVQLYWLLSQARPV